MSILALIPHTRSTAAADLAASTAFPRPASGCPQPPQRTTASTFAGADPKRVPSSRALYPQPSLPPRYDRV